jgi:glucose 1-dehydrogenase
MPVLHVLGERIREREAQLAAMTAGSSIYDRLGLQDMTLDDIYFERGINLRHGYLTEYYVEDADFVVRLPDTLRDVGVLLEPISVA